MAAPAAAPPTPTADPPGPRWWRRPWILPLALFSLAFLGFALPPYAGLDPEAARFPIREDVPWHYPVMVTHIFGGAVLTLLVILQVWPWLRARHPAVHRWSGRTYVMFGVSFVGVPALLIAPLSHTGISGQASSVVWALLWLSCTVLGYRMARRRRYAEHREWMLRSFVLLFGIALNRPVVFLFILIAIPQLDTTFGGDTDAMAMAIAPASSFLSWVLPLLFVEWWIKYRRPRGPRPGTGAATA
ncbi:MULTISPECIES: DUF2306 domain-containing protein [Nocardiopsis]|uniref:DUF2306 domain-containing protein n=1 Tax=Nocardiopsis sinuspersici TaxID=501010 RepID=A0A1V3BZ10_9ACTN|nr:MULTISPECIES: DUF2306 domain-containing protein [Nocardiopsis]OOC53489.1 hypothetical protein NOSIN_06450 [Nocardiopsis sinuspersici]